MAQLVRLFFTQGIREDDGNPHGHYVMCRPVSFQERERRWQDVRLPRAGVDDGHGLWSCESHVILPPGVVCLIALVSSALMCTFMFVKC